MKNFIRDYGLFQLKNFILAVSTVMIWVSTKNWIPFYRVLFTVLWVPICGRGIYELYEMLNLRSKKIKNVSKKLVDEYFADE